MSQGMRFAWQHFCHYRGRSLTLVASIVLVLLLPLVVKLVVDDFAQSLTARAAASPLVLGSKGSRYDLVLAALYFRGRVPESLSMAEVNQLVDEGLVEPIPLHLGYRAQGFPVVGTTHDYYGFRQLAFAAGGAPALIGEAVLGADVARELGLGVGDGLLSDQGSLFELSLTYPLRMRVVGVLERSGGPEDGVVLCDIKTAWILGGLGHGHVAAEAEREDRLLARDGGRSVLGAATFQHNEVTEENIDGFHFHGDASHLPVEAVLCVPRDRKAATILKGRYRTSADAQLLVPSEVVEELLGLVFRIRRFFDVNALFVSGAMAILFGLVFVLSLRLRAREFESLRRIGFANTTLARLVLMEWALILGLGIGAVALLGLGAARLLASHGDRLFLGGGLA